MLCWACCLVAALGACVASAVLRWVSLGGLAPFPPGRSLGIMALGFGCTNKTNVIYLNQFIMLRCVSCLPSPHTPVQKGIHEVGAGAIRAWGLGRQLTQESVMNMSKHS